jgi:hypothetical protein
VRPKFVLLVLAIIVVFTYIILFLNFGYNLPIFIRPASFLTSYLTFIFLVGDTDPYHSESLINSVLPVIDIIFWLALLFVGYKVFKRLRH